MDPATFFLSRQFPSSLAAEYKTYAARSLPDSHTFESDKLPEYRSNCQVLNGASFPQSPPKARLAGRANDQYAPSVEAAEKAMTSDIPRSYQNLAPSRFRSVYTKVACIFSPRLKRQDRMSQVEPGEVEIKLKYVNGKFLPKGYKRCQI